MRRRTESRAIGWFYAVSAIAIAAVSGSGCSDDDHPVVPQGSGCLDCHGDEARLVATADPDEEPHSEDPGEG